MGACGSRLWNWGGNPNRSTAIGSTSFNIQYFDDTLGVVYNVHPLEHFAVLSTSNLSNDFVLFLIAPIHSQRFIIPVFTRTLNVYIRVNSVSRRGMEIRSRPIGPSHIWIPAVHSPRSAHGSCWRVAFGSNASNASSVVSAESV